MILTVWDSIGTVTRSLKFGISSKDDVEDLLLGFASRGTVSDSLIPSGSFLNLFKLHQNSLMTTTGFCNLPCWAGPRTKGWRIFCHKEVPRGVKPENLICWISWRAWGSLVIPLPSTREFIIRTWIPSWSKREVAKATRERMLWWRMSQSR